MNRKSLEAEQEIRGRRWGGGIGGVAVEPVSFCRSTGDVTYFNQLMEISERQAQSRRSAREELLSTMSQQD